MLTILLIKHVYFLTTLFQLTLHLAFTFARSLSLALSLFLCYLALMSSLPFRYTRLSDFVCDHQLNKRI